MSGIDFKPENMLEKAIFERDPKRLLQGVAEELTLNRLVAASNLGSECFTDEVVYSVLLLAITEKQLETMKNGWFWGYLHAGERVKTLVNEALKPLPLEPSSGEKKLIRAILYRDNEEICRLIREERVQFEGFAPELLIMLPELSKEGVLAFLKEGLSPQLKAIVLGILLKEVETPELLKSFPYRQRVKYANLMLHLMAGEEISPENTWFPDDLSCPFFYYFDPEHKYNPAFYFENREKEDQET